MGVFTADFRKQFFFTDMENKEYELINKLFNSYSLNLFHNNSMISLTILSKEINKLNIDLYITKTEDDYYNITIFNSITTYYKCDQLIGLKECILFLKNKYEI